MVFILMRVLRLAFIFVVSTVCALAQTVDGPHSLLDYRFLSPASQSLHRGQLLVSYDDRQGLFAFDSTSTSPTPVMEFENTVAAALFHVGEVLMATTYDGTLRYFDDAQNRWRKVGVYDCRPFVDGRNLYVLDGTTVSLLRYDSGSWVDSTIGQISNPDSSVVAFAVVRDTIVYSFVGSNIIYIASSDGMILQTLRSHSPVDNFLILEDGSIAITAIQRTSQFLRAGTLGAGIVDALIYKSSIVSLTKATAIESHSSRGVIGTLRVAGDDPREGVYVVLSPDSIVRRYDLDSIMSGAINATQHGAKYVLSEQRKLAIVDGSNMARTFEWFSDTSLAYSDGISFSADGVPFLSGYASIGGQARPTLYPTSDTESIKVLSIDSKQARLLIRHVQLEGGPEVAFCSYDIFVRPKDGEWSSAYTSQSDFRSRLIDVVNDSLIVVRSVPRHLLISRDKGLTWRAVAVKDYLSRMEPVVSDGAMLYGLAQGQIWAFDLNMLSDSVAPPTVKIPIGSLQRLFASKSRSVQAATAISVDDPSYNPTSYTHILIHRWDPFASQLESVTHGLKVPLESSGAILFAKNDTVYLWHSTTKRLVASTFAGIAYDTTFVRTTFGAFDGHILGTVVTDNQGVPWLFASGFVTGFRLDPNAPVVSSIHDYYDYLYVQSISPNPASDNTRLTLGRFAAATEDGIRLYLVDLQGSCVRSYSELVSSFPGPTSTQEVDINVEGLPWGVYLVVIENRQGKSVGKLIITP